MNTILITIIIVSGISNMIADILLVSGKDYSKKNQSREDRVKNTPTNHIIISGILGLVSIAFWTVPIYYLAKIQTIGGTVAMFSFAAYISTLTAFHVACSYSTLCYKLNGEGESVLLKKILKWHGLISVVWSGIYTFTMIYLSFDILKLGVLHYVTLPLFSMIIIQFILGKLLNKIPHFSSIAGTLGMVISFLGTISIMIENNII